MNNGFCSYDLAAKCIYFLKLFIFYDCAVSSLLLWPSLVEESRGYSLVALWGLLFAVASLVAELGLQGVRFSVVATPRL